MASLELEVKNKYGIIGCYSSVMTMRECELYSGTERDPEVIGHLHAMDIVPEYNGERLPYDVFISMPLFQLSEGEALEDMSWRMRMNRQKVRVNVVIFRDKEGMEMYKRDEVYYCL